PRGPFFVVFYGSKIEFFVTQRPLSPHFSVIPVGKIFFSVFSIHWETRNSGHRYYLLLHISININFY
ncbi:hypothetical protein, partial [Heyndrickxia faecalis]|uniref:hypothetical protein n=1 Tax=Heyndrickxia faecalis TaxID=2824910 RepID=UPI0032B1ED38